MMKNRRSHWRLDLSLLLVLISALAWETLLGFVGPLTQYDVCHVLEEAQHHG
jgi:hypothetical protein